MRALICLCLASGLLAGEPPLPGRDGVFLTRVLARAEGDSRPWKTFRVPEASASAVVEVFGELTREELRQVAFQEFIVWFREDLRRFWRSQGATVPAGNLASAALPVERFGGNPVPQNVPLGSVNF
ncbi:MAG: hypothetical protein HXX12_06155 [Geothrix sp.]|uniref:hypothetical protein n=1 Tax=Geothrix sp. TaxID=1962974 RepID=UPI00182098F6|nr:hypothetical protein [Geothrix sp.]NWJ40536.1 hypothetical protein [Geothrix sp.]WIL21459.1 MAG: hypothetical protein QOZ81_000721 [Geothrix sp.]